MLQRNPRLVFMADKEEEEQRKTTMLGCNNEDTRWREKMLGGNNGLWTVECLRGRLLAERAASRAAKLDAELLGKKLIELQQKLKLEIKLKNKAEKKLKYLMGKLERLELSHMPVSSSSLNTEDSCTSSSASSGLTEQLEQNSEMSESTDQQKMGTKIDDIASVGSRTSSVSSRAGADQPDDNNGETCSDVSDSINSPDKESVKGESFLRQTPTSKACQRGTSNKSRKINNSHSLLYCAGA